MSFRLKDSFSTAEVTAVMDAIKGQDGSNRVFDRLRAVIKARHSSYVQDPWQLLNQLVSTQGDLTSLNPHLRIILMLNT